MTCMDPVLCYTGKKRIYRNFSMASPLIKKYHQTKFDCGKCIFCRKKRAKELAIRCVLESTLYDQSCFLTLTYDETRPEYHNNFQYKDIQDFKKRLRRYCSYHFGKNIKIFNVHEYGKNGKKHWHLVVFNHQFSDREKHTIKNGNTLYKSEQLTKLWGQGFASIGDVTEASAMYQAQYTQKDLKNGNQNNSKKAHSKHSGIGKGYFLKHHNQILRLGYVPFGNKKIPIPRYFQKLAHKHYCHFYEKSAFFDTQDRKKLYNLFKESEANKQIADNYIIFKNLKQAKEDKNWLEWQQEIQEHIWNNKKPNFTIAAENYLYDLNNKKSKGDF